ncbi:cellulose biosynthesis protein BcsD [Candidatus Sodalis pierantonius]|uniref:cellulose biosynthesis protein BcsD n=1 Tax=Candidatus Sodalis pierantonii TaxID=1486991 RepID=UPI000683DB4B
MGLLIAGISDNAGDEDKRQFLNLVGEQLACRFPQPAAATVGELEDGLNRLWSCFHWGYVRLTPDATAPRPPGKANRSGGRSGRRLCALAVRSGRAAARRAALAAGQRRWRNDLSL